MSIALYPYNILESGTLTVTGTADTGYPESRLHDRSAVLLWKDTVTEAKTFHIDQGASNILPVDLLYVAGHNFDGATLAWQYSDDDSAWTDAVTGWTQGGNGVITKSLSSAVSHRYWRFTVTSMSNPQCGEIIMSRGYAFTLLGDPRPIQADRGNVARFESIGGMSRRVKLGDPRRSWDMDLRLGDAAARNSLLAVLDYTGGTEKPLIIKDMDGNYYLMELLEDPRIERAPINRGYTTLRLLEAL
ncbi:MAG: hypothetical protein DRH56_09160 [Deltaproteobacteria bacterium]|nr:MAG: hypothetical protein DRH56_09160 [Deltaproteobacteria bacterium]